MISSYGFLSPSILRLSISALSARTTFESESSDFSDSRNARKRTAHAESAAEARSDRTAAIGAAERGEVELAGCHTHEEPASAHAAIQTRRITAPLAEVMVHDTTDSAERQTRRVFHAHARRVFAAPRSKYVTSDCKDANGRPRNARPAIELQSGAYRDRTDDLLVANQALSQLS